MMLLPGCPCCGTCDDCTRTCTNPHTGGAFEVVYSYKFEGAEAGNTSDGYLTAVGDADASDPYNGMDGSSPWQQQITGSFSLNNTQTRYPCWVRVSFWRSNFVLGANTIPPPSTALTLEEIKITNSAGSQGSIVLNDYGTVLAPGDSYSYTSIPLVSGAGDQSGSDPLFGQGTVAFRQACANESVTVDVSATIKWTTQKRQHILYGIVRECYETGSPCSSFCGGAASPNTIYLEITNFGGTHPDSPFFVEGTYVLERVPNTCSVYQAVWPDDCSGFSGLPVRLLEVYAGGGVFMKHYTPINGGLCVNLTMSASGVDSICGTGVIDSGTNGQSYYEGVYNGTFNWKITA